MEEKTPNTSKSELYNTYRTGLNFRYNLDLAKGENVAAINANIYLGKCYEECANDDRIEVKEDALDGASKYYVIALRLAKKLNQDQAATHMITLLKNIGRDENGDRIPGSDLVSSSVPGSSPF